MANIIVYNEDSIDSLEGLDPVRMRPGMYTRTENPLHILQEVVDNSSDEALGGHATKIKLTMHTDGAISVQDNGRGIPVGINKKAGISAAELIFTKLHSGGKFDKKSYKLSGGLHGVGVSVTNALSLKLEATIIREGKRHQISFANGYLANPITEIGDARGHGTSIKFWADPKYFDTPTFPLGELEKFLISKAVLCPGLEVTLNNEIARNNQTWKFERGLEGYLEEALNGLAIIPIISGEKFAGVNNAEFAEGEGASFAITFTEEGTVIREAYVNLIHTKLGGTHVAGLRDAIYSSVKNFMEMRQMMPKGVKLLAEDVFARASFVLSASISEPQFQGQTKDSLSSRETMKLVSSLLKPVFELWLNEHTDYAKKIVELSLKAANARAKGEQVVVKRKGSGASVLPGKLTDCESTDINRNELFLVEGDSAGGSAKLARDKENQALLPLRGKVLNTWDIDGNLIFKNTEVHDIAVANGIEPHNIADLLDSTKLRYGKIIIMSDADVDGSHIQVLLMTLFLKHFPQIILEGRLYVAQPPLFRIDAPPMKGGQKDTIAKVPRSPRKFYALDFEERDAILDKLYKEGFSVEQCRVSRFKGLGEMNPDQLWETAMSPDTRRLIRVECPIDRWDEMLSKFTMLMGENEASSRRTWLEAHGHETEGDI